MMTTLLVKTDGLPLPASARATGGGMQYTVAIPGYLDGMIVNGASLTCTCSQPAFAHLQMVQLCGAPDKARDARCAVYSALVDLSYGDIA